MWPQVGQRVGVSAGLFVWRQEQHTLSLHQYVVHLTCREDQASPPSAHAWLRMPGTTAECSTDIAGAVSDCRNGVACQPVKRMLVADSMIMFRLNE